MTRKIRNRPEQALQIAVAQFLDLALPGTAWWMHVPNAAKRGVVEAVMFKRLGMKAGAPDLFIFWRSRCYAIELKSEAGSLSETQRNVHELLHMAGVPVVVCRSIKEVEYALRTWFFPLRVVAA